MEKVATVRVIFGDTDAMGIVYYANYLRWFEVARVELMRLRGFDRKEMDEDGIRLPVIEARVSYKAPALQDDLLDLHAGIAGASGVRLTFGYRIARASDSRTLVEGYTVHAFTDSRGKVVRPSARVRSIFR